MPPCPICQRQAQPRESNGAFPFCTPRCKTIDLGKWLDEAYRLPAEDESQSDESSKENG